MFSSICVSVCECEIRSQLFFWAKNAATKGDLFFVFYFFSQHASEPHFNLPPVNVVMRFLFDLELELELELRSSPSACCCYLCAASSMRCATFVVVVVSRRSALCCAALLLRLLLEEEEGTAPFGAQSVCAAAAAPLSSSTGANERANGRGNVARCLRLCVELRRATCCRCRCWNAPLCSRRRTFLCDVFGERRRRLASFRSVAFGSARNERLAAAR